MAAHPSPAKSQVSRKDASILVLIVAFLFGGWLRFTPALNAAFPINDGGMFYTMITDLIKNKYLLPPFTTYNHLNIPYAYPPLPFYLAAALFDLFHIPLLQLLMWIPALVSTLCILAAYKLAQTLTGDALKASLAALCYALIPQATAWLLMGGGLTRSLGMLFLLLMLDSAHRLFQAKGAKELVPTILWGSLTVLSHPSMASIAIGCGIFLFLFFFDWKNIALAIKVAAGVALLTAPWWGTIIYYHGIAPLVQAPQTGYYNFLWAFQQIGLLQMAPEKFLTIIGVFGLVGLIWLIARGEFIIPLLLLVPYIANPRSAGLIVIIPVCIAAAAAFLEILMPAFGRIAQNEPPFGLPAKILSGYFFCILLLNGYVQADGLSQVYLSQPNREALEWVKENTPPDAAFLIIDGNTDPFSDPLLEWFPTRAERYSVSTIQGLEWTRGNRFFQYMQNVMDVQKCYFKGANCLQEKALTFPIYNYLLITKQCGDHSEFASPALEQVDSPLITSLTAHPEQHQKKFENENVIIYLKR